jgi:hypothetical protein
MIRCCTLLAAVTLAACSPQGWLRSERGAERIRTAFHLNTSYYGERAKAVVLSNSHFPCSLPDTQDPDAITQAEAEYLMAYSREGSMLVAFVLFSHEDGSWSGRYPVDEAASPFGLDEVEPRAAMAAFRAVWEAEVSEEDGLYREYEPVVEEQHIPVEGPGEISVQESGDGERFEGSFTLDSIDVSGRFETRECVDGDGDLLGYLDLFAVTPSPGDDTRDTGGWLYSGGTP